MRYVYAMRPTALIPCLLAPTLLAACGGPAPPASAPPAPPPACELHGNFQQTVYTVIGRDRALSDTSYGLLLADRKSGATLCAESVGGDQQVYPASAIKTLIAVALFRLIDRGAVSLQDIVSISQPNAADECSRWECSLYGPGKRVSVKTLVFDMITVSNNIATKQLIDLLSKDECNRTADLLGAPSLRIIRKVYDTVNPEPQIQDRNHATAAGLVELYREILSGRLGVLQTGSRELLIDILGQQRINGSLNGDFPATVKFFHKTGNTSEVTTDGGFYYLDERTAAVLVGLQRFVDFQTLRAVGKTTLDLTRNLPRTTNPTAGG